MITTELKPLERFPLIAKFAPVLVPEKQKPNLLTYLQKRILVLANLQKEQDTGSAVIGIPSIKLFVRHKPN